MLILIRVIVEFVIQFMTFSLVILIPCFIVGLFLKGKKKIIMKIGLICVTCFSAIAAVTIPFVHK